MAFFIDSLVILKVILFKKYSYEIWVPVLGEGGCFCYQLDRKLCKCEDTCIVSAYLVSSERMGRFKH